MAAARTILAFDTAGDACSAALWRDGAVLARRFEAMRRGQSERLMPMIEEVMAAAGLRYGALEALAVTRGPGAFTGLRIGLAAAQGLALARGLPVIAITSFEAHLAGLPTASPDGATGIGSRSDTGPILVALNAKRSDLYCQVFTAAGEPLTAPLAVTAATLPGHCPAGPLHVIGDAASQAAEWLGSRAADLRRLRPPVCHADAGRFVVFAARQEARAQPAAAIQPLYLRAPDVTQPAAQAAPFGAT